MTDSVVDAFVRHFASIEDSDDRAKLLSRVKLQAMSQAPEAAFEPPIRTLGKYLDDPIEVPPTLVEPYIVVRGGITCTIGRAGKGKSLPLTAKVLSPAGWVQMGDIRVGDLVVDPTTGFSAPVSGVYPQGLRDTFLLSFDDGAQVQADGEHLWSVSRNGGRDQKVLSTLDIKNSIDGGERNWLVPTTLPVQHPTAVLPVDPYVLGLLLGDGSLRQCFTGNPRGRRIGFTTADYELKTALEYGAGAELVSSGKYDYRVNNAASLLDAVIRLGLGGTGSHDKFVPPEYLVADVAQRIALLQGLMDTDGHAKPPGGAEFCSVSKNLADSVASLVRSLGGRAAVSTSTNDFGPYWRVNVSFSGDIAPFRLARKAETFKARTSRRHEGRVIVNVVAADPAPCQCIMVDSEAHLFVTDDYIVTHNTVMNLNRILKWAAGKPMFDGWTDADGNKQLVPTKPLKTLVIENEGAGGLFHRQIGIMLHAEGYLDEEERKLAKDNILIWGDGGYSGLKLDDAKKLAEVRRGCEIWKPDVIFVEPFRGLWQGEENSATDMTKVVDALVEIAADFKCGVMLAHHERKSGTGDDGEKMSAGRGSTVLEGAVTVMENFESAKGGEGRDLSWSKSRHGKAPNPVRMEWDADAWWYKWVPDSDLDNKLMDAITQSPEALNISSLCEYLDEKDTKVRKVAETLAAAGRLKKIASVPNPHGSGTTGTRYRLPAEEGFTGGLAI